MKRSILLFLLLPACLAGNAQSSAIKREEWSSRPTLHTMTPQELKQSAVVISDVRRIEFIDEGDKVAGFTTYHRLIHVNDNTGIESFNKIYLSAGDKRDIVDIKARTILPDGKIINVDARNIKDLKEDDGSEYKIFAMEGLEKGCEVEYTYTYKGAFSWFGKHIVQSKFSIRNALFEIIAPDRLTFRLKGYNCAPSETDTTLAGKNIFTSTLHNIPAVEDEKYAAYKANLQSIAYRLAYNKLVSKGQKQVLTWHELARNAHVFYGGFSDRELAKVDELIAAAGWDKSGTPFDRITAVENFLKKQFNARKNLDNENGDNIEWILKNKLATYKGIIRLYKAIYMRLNINAELVMTCSREDGRIDRNFEDWNSTSQTVLYFPETGKSLAPTEQFIRYPLIQPFWAGHEALFCRPVMIGTYATAVAEFRQLPLEDFSRNFSKVESAIHLNAGMDTMVVDMKQSYGGYVAIYMRAAENLAPEEEKKTFLKQMVKFGTNSEHIISSSIDNASFESINKNEPFIVNATVHASELVENAGNKVLVRIGDIIGPQTEMYQDKARVFPIELSYPHSMERTITFRLPDGYAVKNLDDLNVKSEFRDKDEVTMGFTSGYSIEGQELKIHIMELYKRIYYPLSQYEDFRKIINASADFNKVVLVLEKKG